MGPRLGRVEYNMTQAELAAADLGFNGATLRTRGIPEPMVVLRMQIDASMGPRLGRVEYKLKTTLSQVCHRGFNGATLRTRGIPSID